MSYIIMWHNNTQRKGIKRQNRPCVVCKNQACRRLLDDGLLLFYVVKKKRYALFYMYGIYILVFLFLFAFRFDVENKMYQLHTKCTWVKIKKINDVVQTEN